ncbi:MAG: GIY-YIG nuclease family protein [Burkholderiales bacterium]|nr:GIY-YIG nuclease family protein [Burkholderiales bacterium]MDR4517179.1 GIY-YIG nuclease family protein [Nitrosomonas sp.]
MAKAGLTDEDNALLAELGVEVEIKKTGNRTPREERIIAGFEDIERFFEQHGRVPIHGEERDIFERLYAVRLDKIRDSQECRAVLADKDRHGLLTNDPTVVQHEMDNLDDDTLLSELGVLNAGSNDITKLTHVKSRAEIKAAEEIAKRTPCLDFGKFKPLFAEVQEELTSGIRTTRKFKDDAQVEQGDFFILGGQKVFVAEAGEEFIANYGRPDCRLRVIYDNGTESDILMRSLQRALNKDETSRRIIKPSSGILFTDVAEEGDTETGTIYVLRSKSEHPQIQEHRDVIHKIGVTSSNIERRVANAKLDPTFLMADVEIVATYELSNINRVKLENLIHRFFESAKLNIEIKDRFGNPVVPREWFLVPLFVIDEMIEKIKDGSIVNYKYDSSTGKIVR